MFGDSLGHIDKTMRSVTYLDGTATPLECEVVFIDGDVSVSGLSKFLNEKTANEGNGKYHGTTHGNRTYPTFTISAKIDEFSTGVTTAGTVLDFWNSQAGTLYAAAADAIPAGALGGREPHRHAVVRYQKTDSVAVTLSFESCNLDAYDFDDEEKGMITMTHTCRGRVFADGVLVSGPVGCSTTAPDWVPDAT